jgi:nitrate/nitrite transporter NarK
VTAAELFWKTISWFWMVWFVSAGIFVILVQFLLPQARRRIRAHPPRGPAWAYSLWYNQARVYGALMALSIALGLIAAAIFLVTST